MATDFYTKSGNPGQSAFGDSSAVRTEFGLIETGFGKLPALSSTGSKFWRTNAGGTAAEAVAATGTGSVVLSTSATLVTPTLTTPTMTGAILGTPTSGTLTNCMLPVGGVTGLGTGVATFLATPSSVNLKAAVTDETGSGALVFANTPTLVTPVLGAATATSINGLTISSSTGTFTLTNGKTLAVSNTLTFSGTDGTSLNINAVTNLNFGSYTPTLSNGTGISSSTVRPARWIRINNYILVTGQVDLTPSSALGYGFELSFPVASNITQTYDIGGVGNGLYELLVITGSVANDTAVFATTVTGPGSTNAETICYHYLYPVQ